MYKLEEMQYTGIRLTAEQCKNDHIIYEACHIDNLMRETIEFAKSHNKKRAIIKELKLRLNRKVIDTIDTEDPPYIESGKFHIG